MIDNDGPVFCSDDASSLLDCNLDWKNNECSKIEDTYIVCEGEAEGESEGEIEAEGEEEI